MRTLSILTSLLAVSLLGWQIAVNAQSDSAPYQQTGAPQGDGAQMPPAENGSGAADQQQSGDFGAQNGRHRQWGGQGFRQGGGPGAHWAGGQAGDAEQSGQGGGFGHGPRRGGPGDGDRRAARRQRLMERFDTNHDGKLDENERAQMQAFLQKRRDMRRERMQQGGGQGMQQGGGQGMQQGGGQGMQQGGGQGMQQGGGPQWRQQDSQSGGQPSGGQSGGQSSGQGSQSDN